MMGVSLRSITRVVIICCILSFLTDIYSGPIHHHSELDIYFHSDAISSENCQVNNDVLKERDYCSYLDNRVNSNPGFHIGTLFGGTQSGDESISSLDVNSIGNIYIGGMTDSQNLPISAHAFDVSLDGPNDIFLASIDSNFRSLIYCTYFGGNSVDILEDILILPNDEVVLVGYTKSDDFPLTENAFCTTHMGDTDGFFSILNLTESSLKYSTYIGGSWSDRISSVQLDSKCRICIIGTTTSRDFPTTTNSYSRNASGYSDGFALRFNKEITDFEFSTYLGGELDDTAECLDITSNDSLIIMGKTQGHFPVTTNAYSNNFINNGEYILQYDPDSSDISFATYCPDGRDLEQYSDMVIHSNGDIIILGTTNSTDFPTTEDAIQRIPKGDSDIFLSIISGNASNLKYSTILGGSGYDEGTAIDICPNENAVVITGYTYSRDLPVTPGSFDILFRDKFNYFDSYLIVFNVSNPNLTYLSYIGGDLSDYGEEVKWVAQDQVLISGMTKSSDFFTSKSAFQSKLKSGEDGFLYEINPIRGNIPGIPTNYSISTTQDLVFLQWYQPENFGGCRIQQYSLSRTTAKSDWIELQKSSNTSYEDHQIDHGATYHYRVAAINSVGIGDYIINSTTIPVIPPTEPLDLRSSTGNGSVTLNWTPPTDLGGGRIREYVIHRGPTRDELTVLETVGNVTWFIDDTANLGEFVYYAVAARNGGGTGPLSAAVRIKPVAPPGAPTGFMATGGDGKVTLKWVAPASDGGSMLLGYYVYRGTALNDVERIVTKAINQLEHVDAGLVNGMQYIYYVTAYTDVTESTPSTAVDVTPYGLPGRVLNLTVLASDGEVTLTWSPPDTDGGSQITKYKVFCGEGDAGSITYLTQIGNVTTFTHTGLENGVAYFYQVTAVNAAGEGQVSLRVSAMPLGLPGSVRDLAASSDRAGIRLTWRTPADIGGAGNVTYVILRGDSPEDPETTYTVPGALEFLDTNVTVGMTYRYWVLARTSVGDGPAAGPVEATAVTVPGSVRDLVTIYGDRTVTLSWSAPADDGGSPVTEYIIKRGIFAAGMVEVARVDGLEYTDTGLDNGKTYLYTVVPVNAVGTGAEADPVEGTPLGPPAAPGLFKAEVKGRKVMLSWAKPGGSDRAPATGYRILRATGLGDFEEIDTLGDVTVYTDDNVKEGKKYSYKVVSLSDIGEGSSTQPIDVKIKNNDEGPGFGLLIALLTKMIASIYIARTRDKYPI